MKHPFMDIPNALLEALPLAKLQELYDHLKRTRRRVFVFGLNGMETVMSRRLALALVREHLQKRTP